MADIRPFRCVRPADALVDQVAALPYDVYNRAEARQVVDGRPKSFLNIDRPETQFPEDYDMYAPEVYAKARELFDQFIAEGTFITDEDVAYYVYALTMDGRRQCGIVAASSVDDYLNNVIKKHENTRAEKEADRIKHVDTLSAQTGPIFLAYRKNLVISQVIAETMETDALFDFTSEDGIRHEGWKISDADKVAAIQQAFAQINEIYIADGHHRAASAVKVGLKRREAHPGYDQNAEFNYFLSVLFAGDELMILPYNRVLKSMNGHSKEELFALLEKNFELCESAEAVNPAKKGSFGFYIDGKWHTMTAKPAFLSDDPVKGLDVSILQEYVLTPVFGIQDPKTDNRIDFVGGIRGLKELERRCEEDCVLAFSMYATSIDELFAVADANLLMPPKSTWFEPKLRSGLFIHRIEE